MKRYVDGCFYTLLIKTIYANKWLLFLPLLLTHLLVLGECINHHKNLVEINEKASHAMERLVIHAGQLMSLRDFKVILTEIDSTGIHVGDYKLTFSVVEFRPLNPYVKNKVLDFYYPLRDGQWLHYTVTPTINFFDFPLWMALFEMLVITLIVLYFLWRSKFVVSLKNFKLSAERIGHDFNPEFFQGHGGPPIVRETADAVNKMQQRIHDLINSRTQLLATISHDLRIPITRLKLRAQFVQDTEQSDKIIQDLDEMEAMITEILGFARNDVAIEKKIKFDINALLLSVCCFFIDRGYSVEMSLNPGNVLFFGRLVALKRVFINLIENSMRYAEQVSVSLMQTNEQIIITVEDRGPGIPEEELEKVLQPYYRLENSASRNNVGVGLGLTIVSEIVKFHEGTLSLMNCDQGGLRVTIILPMVEE
jgi:signal transduction histidine kinase